MSGLVRAFQQRVEFGAIGPDLQPLLKLKGVKPARAKALWMEGLKTVEDIASGRNRALLEKVVRTAGVPRRPRSSGARGTKRVRMSATVPSALCCVLAAGARDLRAKSSRGCSGQAGRESGQESIERAAPTACRPRWQRARRDDSRVRSRCGAPQTACGAACLLSLNDAHAVGALNSAL